MKLIIETGTNLPMVKPLSSNQRLIAEQVEHTESKSYSGYVKIAQLQARSEAVKAKLADDQPLTIQEKTKLQAEMRDLSVLLARAADSGGILPYMAPDFYDRVKDQQISNPGISDLIEADRDHSGMINQGEITLLKGTKPTSPAVAFNLSKPPKTAAQRTIDSLQTKIKGELADRQTAQFNRAHADDTGDFIRFGENGVPWRSAATNRRAFQDQIDQIETNLGRDTMDLQILLADEVRAATETIKSKK